MAQNTWGREKKEPGRRGLADAVAGGQERGAGVEPRPGWAAAPDRAGAGSGQRSTRGFPLASSGANRSERAV